MSDPTKTVSDGAVTGEDMTVRPDTASSDNGAREEDFLPVGGPRSGDEDEGGTQDAGINPDEEITPG
jgi:hypothetical protein